MVSRGAAWACQVLGCFALVGCSTTHRSPEVAGIHIDAHGLEPPSESAVQAKGSTQESSIPSARLEPTWGLIYARYFAPETEGGCGRAGACHRSQTADAASTYEWLSERGYIAGTQSPLVSPTNSCLRWFGGNMPPRGQPNASAARDLNAWVAAGAKND